MCGCVVYVWVCRCMCACACMYSLLIEPGAQTCQTNTLTLFYISSPVVDILNLFSSFYIYKILHENYWFSNNVVITLLR